jgi:serine/threonine protein kinase
VLERRVALKILPPELVRSEDRVRRFVLEAKSASSLSHPNIVTIYEIGQAPVRSQGAPDSDPVHYVSMELVSGKTLSTLIHDDKTDLRTLVGYLAQAAEGLAKAHAAGIVHRDLKPGNIMVSADGFTKVLDFGLAKLTEKREGAPDISEAPTLAADGSAVGSVVGTAGYMSPEQVQGRAIDHRSDIFSFGCILYEAATRRKPFAAGRARRRHRARGRVVGPEAGSEREREARGVPDHADVDADEPRRRPRQRDLPRRPPPRVPGGRRRARRPAGAPGRDGQRRGGPAREGCHSREPGFLPGRCSFR